MLAASPANRTESSQLWVPVGAFLLTGVLAAIILASPYSSESRGLAVTLWAAFGQVVTVAAVTVVVARFTLASFTRWDAQERASFALLFGGLGVWFVPLAFLAVRHRFWALAAAIALGWAAGRLTRRCGAADEESAGLELAPAAALLWREVSGFAPRSAAWPVLAAALADLGLFVVLGGDTPRGAVLAGAGGFVLGVKAAPAIAPAPFQPLHMRRWMQLAAGVLGAFVLTSLLTVRLPAGSVRGVPGAPAAPDGRVAGKDLIAGAILMGKPVGVVSLTAPPPARRRMGPIRPHRPQQPMAFDFSGVYWVSSRARMRPSPNWLIVRESPLEYKFTKLDRGPLPMEARQQLPVTIDPGCCSQLEMTVYNADPQPQSIMLEVVLAAGDEGRARRLPLGKQRVTGMGSLTLRYPIPASAEPLGANLIIVNYHLYMPRMNRSADLAIERFVLVPKQW